MNRLRLVMMGTGPFAVPTFRSLLASPHEVVCLVTRPDHSAHSRKPVPLNPVRHEAPEGLPILDPEDANSLETRRHLAAWRPDLLVVCDFGQILTPETLGVAPLGGINLHGSLLPKFRGAAPVNWALRLGEAETGVSVIHMTARLDAGPCLVQLRTPIAWEEDAVQLEQRLAVLGVDAVRRAIELLAQWDRSAPVGVPQDGRLATRAPRLSKPDGRVDWNQSAREIYNHVRAFKPWPGTFTYLNRGSGQEPLRLILDSVEVSGEARDTPGATTPAAPGQVVQSDASRVVVATGQGLIALRRVQPAGKRVMEIEEFLRGHHVPVGARLG